MTQMPPGFIAMHMISSTAERCWKMLELSKSKNESQNELLGRWKHVRSIGIKLMLHSAPGVVAWELLPMLWMQAMVPQAFPTYLSWECGGEWYGCVWELVLRISSYMLFLEAKLIEAKRESDSLRLTYGYGPSGYTHFEAKLRLRTAWGRPIRSSTFVLQLQSAFVAPGANLQLPRSAMSCSWFSSFPILPIPIPAIPLWVNLHEKPGRSGWKNVEYHEKCWRFADVSHCL